MVYNSQICLTITVEIADGDVDGLLTRGQI
jgi:hypothetical protein